MLISIKTKANSVFLATILVVGIIAMAFPSLIVESHAQQQYGMQKYKEPKVIVEKIKCNNDNFNLDVVNPEIGQAVSNEIQSLLKKAKSGDNNEQYVLDENIVLICTNNNKEWKFPVNQNPNPPVINPENNLQAPPIADSNIVGCEECFRNLSLELQGQLITSIANLQNPVMNIGDVTLDFTEITETSTLADLCRILDTAINAQGPISMIEIITAFTELLPNLSAQEQAQVAELIICLSEEGIVEVDAGMTIS
jgi:hypothetical protein